MRTHRNGRYAVIRTDNCRCSTAGCGGHSELSKVKIREGDGVIYGEMGTTLASQNETRGGVMVCEPDERE